MIKPTPLVTMSQIKGDLSPDLQSYYSTHLCRVVKSSCLEQNPRLEKRFEAGPGQVRNALGELRRVVSMTMVLANALCLMESLCQLGPGARVAAQRGQAALHLEERRQQERQAFDCVAGQEIME